MGQRSVTQREELDHNQLMWLSGTHKCTYLQSGELTSEAYNTGLRRQNTNLQLKGRSVAKETTSKNGIDESTEWANTCYTRLTGMIIIPCFESWCGHAMIIRGVYILLGIIAWARDAFYGGVDPVLNHRVCTR